LLHARQFQSTLQPSLGVVCIESRKANMKSYESCSLSVKPSPSSWIAAGQWAAMTTHWICDSFVGFTLLHA
jgi:hypothetical protein